MCLVYENQNSGVNTIGTGKIKIRQLGDFPCLCVCVFLFLEMFFF
jgi:hypothetical protein